MQKIIMRFIGTGYNNNYQARVKIYDRCNRLIYNGCTYNGKICVYLKECECYKVVACLNNQIINTKICINRSYYEFAFYNYCMNNNRSNITFLLTDYNFSNLPIERGNIILNG